MRWSQITESGPVLPTIVKPPTDDPWEVAQANFEHAKLVGNRVVPIDQLHGGVALTDPNERRRVDALKAAMTRQGGYISRLIVDTDGNVLEGQHRLDALRELGAETVPVLVIEDLAGRIDKSALEQAMRAAQPLMHSDHVHQLIGNLLDALADENGSVQAVIDEYEEPRGFELAWRAALQALAGAGGK